MQTSRGKFCLDYMDIQGASFVASPPLSSKFVLWPSGNTTLDKRTDSSSFHVRLHKILQDHKSYGKTEMKLKKIDCQKVKNNLFLRYEVCFLRLGVVFTVPPSVLIILNIRHSRWKTNHRHRLRISAEASPRTVSEKCSFWTGSCALTENKFCLHSAQPHKPGVEIWSVSQWNLSP